MITVGRGGVYIDVLVQPNARESQFRGIHGERLKIGVAQAAEDGKANKAVVDLIADLLDVPRSAVTLVAGNTARRKRLHVLGVGPACVRSAINAALVESD